MSAAGPVAVTSASPTTRLVAAVGGVLARRISRRGLIARLALVGSALTASGLTFVLRPGTAYSSICGSGSSCSSGWTAMCCTINDGVNRCPPGTFAGGWWKATGASLCGGKARYIVDCQARCTGCGCRRRGHYCSKRCWSCKPRCARGKGCDKRRACWNVFRYGQCERDIDCSGPVACRAVSCTPPWKWADCSTASATDNRTRHHSSPCLPRWSKINKRYVAMGSQGSVLGATIGRERKGAKGRYQRYTGGRMYRSRKTGTRYLTGEVLKAYRRLGESASPLGLPVTSSRKRTDGGVGADFRRGAVYGARGRRAYGLWGPVWRLWQGQDGPRGPLGYPVSDLSRVGGGELARFEHGSVLRRGSGAAVPVLTEIDAKHRALGTTTGVLGWPLAPESEVTATLGRRARVQRFTGGAVVVTGAGTFAFETPVHDRWVAEGGGSGPLGLPTSDQRRVDATTARTDFEGGYVELDLPTGATEVVLLP